MKQSLQLKLGQQLTMTPQLQQAIRLLQLSSMELELEIQQVLDSNMMLEVDEEDADVPDFMGEAASGVTVGGDEGGDFGGDEGDSGAEDYAAPSTTDAPPPPTP